MQIYQPNRSVGLELERRICAHKACGREYQPVRQGQRYCKKKCRVGAAVKRFRGFEPIADEGQKKSDYRASGYLVGPGEAITRDPVAIYGVLKAYWTGHCAQPAGGL
jgi:hypothetical protein